MLRMITLVTLIFSARLHAAEQCFPESQQRYPVSHKKGLSEGVSEFEARSLIDRFNRTIAPIVKRERSKKLIINLEWENASVNAHCTLDDYDNPVINILGGMIRHPEMTRDGLLLILCHELGHYMGGEPKKFRGRSTLRSWASVEGQADYFATSFCLPLIFNDQVETKAMYEEESEKVVNAEKRCGGSDCVRASLAGLAVARLFATLKTGIDTPTLAKEDRYQVPVTLQTHPNPQCRLDTFVAGGNSDERPLCWFNPKDY